MGNNGGGPPPQTLTRSGAAAWGAASQPAESQVLEEVRRLDSFGRGAEAEQACRVFLERSPQSVPVLNRLALLVLKRGDFAEAEPLLRKAIEVAPRDPGLQNNLGGLLYRRGDLSGAEQAWRRALSIDPKQLDACFNLGIALRALGRSEEALAAFRKTVAIAPSHAGAHAQIGVIMAERGDTRSALAEFDSAVAADRGVFEAHYHRGALLASEERFEDAIASFQAAIAARPDRHEPRYALGNALTSLGRNEAALKSYGEAIKLAPAFLHAHFSYVTLAWSMGLEAAQKLETYAWAREQLGDTPDLLLAEGEFRIRFGELETAERLLRDAHRKANGRADILSTLARALAYQSRFDEAIAAYSDATQLEPANHSHKQELGVVLLRARRAADAARALEESLALAPHDQTTLGYLVSSYRELDDGRALELFDSSLVREFDLVLPKGYASVASFNHALRGELEALHSARVEPLFQTLHNGTQTTGDLFSRRQTPAVQALQEKIREAVAEYIGALGADPTHPFFSRRADEFSFSASWSCRLNPTGYHSNHVHSKGWISSAYYVALPETVAGSPHKEGWIKFGESNLLLGGADRAERFVEPSVGKLVLFPSYFWHGTVPFSSDETRLTVAFDVVPGKLAPPVPDWAKW